jgi:hypothetical protein
MSETDNSPILRRTSRVAGISWGKTWMVGYLHAQTSPRAFYQAMTG